MHPKTAPSVLKSIFLKLTAITVLITAVVAGVTTVMNWADTKALIDDIVRDRAAAETAGLSGEVSGAIRFGHAEKVNQAFSGLMEHSDGTLLSALALGVDGAVVSDPENQTPTDEELAALARKALEQQQVVTSEDGFLVAAPSNFGESQEIAGAIATRWSSQAMLDAARKEEIKALVIATLVFLAAVAANVFLLHRTVASPLRRLQAVITAFGERNYLVDVPMQSRQDEVGSISRSLSHLSATLVQAQAAELDSTLKGAAFMGSSAAMLLVDQNMVVTHFNAKMVELFREHAAPLKQYIP